MRSRLLLAIPFALIPACSFDLGKLFMRDDPQVEEARQALEASTAGQDADLPGARTNLEQILTFRCDADGGRDLVIDRPGASIDLGLVLFRTSELIGRKFGDEEIDGGTPEADEQILEARARELECAQLFLIRLAEDPATDPKIAMRARYLLGNFAFLAKRYADAIARYDQVLLAHPARGTEVADAGAPADEDAVARAAAWNRAIALKRLEDKKDAGPDAPDSRPPDAADGGDTGNDGGDTGNDGGDTGKDGGEDGAQDTGGGANDSGSSEPDTGSGQDTSPPAPASASVAPPPSSSAVDLRELDRFDKAAPLDLDFKKKLEQ
jgi:hypothetical protein